MAEYPQIIRWDEEVPALDYWASGTTGDGCWGGYTHGGANTSSQEGLGHPVVVPSGLDIEHACCVWRYELARYE